MRWVALSGVCLVLSLGCGREPGAQDRLLRKPVAPAPQSGWARMVLDREAQRVFPEVWLGNEQGRSVPFLVARDDLWAPRNLPVGRQLLGKDGQGRPMVEIQLGLPEGWRTGDREHLTFHLELMGEEPWVCRAQVERALEGGAWSRLSTPRPLHLYALGAGAAGAASSRELTVPWEAMRYRVTLEAVHGKLPELKGLRIVAGTRPEDRPEDLRLEPRVEPVAGEPQTWDLRLDGVDRIVGAEVELAPPAAPLAPRWFSVEDRSGVSQEALPGEGLLWNIPALGSCATRVALGPVVSDHLRLRLPEGAGLGAVRLLVRRDVLILPAQAGERLWLHMGGQIRKAPGNLEALPQSSRMIYERKPLSLGPSESDPQGVLDPAHRPDPIRKTLPWVAGFAVLIMGALGFRLMRGSS